MAPDTSLQPFVNASASSMALPTIPTSPKTIRDMALDEELMDPDAQLILSDFTQITEYFPMDMYRSMFFVNTLDHEYNRAVESFDALARKLYDTSLSEDAVSKIKQDMSRNLNLMVANRHETLAEAARLYETVDQAFNTLDASIAVSEQNLQNPPSTTYFLPSSPLEEEEEVEDEADLSDVSSEGDDIEDDTASIKTDDLTPAHLHETELKALRRRMKKSIQWVPTPSCIKKELQSNGRWPPVSATSNKPARRKRHLAKLKRKRQKQMQKVNRVRAARKASQKRTENNTHRRKRQKTQDAKELYSMPVAADEPTYCYCGDVSYGEMIACENESCPKEWFHLECAGLDTAPRGKWFCRDCKPGRESTGSGRKRKRA